MLGIRHILWNWIEKVTYTILTVCFMLIKKKLSDEDFSSFMQFIKFGIVGISNTLISYILYVISLLIFQRFHLFVNIDYLIAQIIAFALSVLWSFYWNNKLVFVLGENEKRSTARTLVKTYISYSFTGIFLSGVLLVIWIQIFHVSEFLAPIVNLLISVPLNFLMNKFWAYQL